MTPPLEGEFALIDRLKAKLGHFGPRVKLGPGDDAAIVNSASPGHDLLLSSDAMVEGIHFDFAYATAEDLGHKALSSALSDLAAMNGRPLYALVSLALTKEMAAPFIDGFYSTAARLAERLKFDIVGGDLTRSKAGVFIDVAVIGETAKPFKRAGAKPGDWLAVSGHPGASAAGLHVLQKRLAGHPQLAKAHLRPEARFDLLPGLNYANLCTSLIDISDGLASEAHHLAKHSGVGFVIESGKLPLDPEALKVDESKTLEWCLSGGEDYELLTTLDPTIVESLGGPPAGFTIIGHATHTAGEILLVGAGGRRILAPTGFNHFA